MFGLFGKSAATRSANAPQPRTVELPAEVIAFLQLRDELNASECAVNVLDEQACAARSSAMQAMGMGKRLGLIVLNDASDSNPYCYITEGAAAGMVVHYSHDPEPAIQFASLPAFASFLRELHAQERMSYEADVAAPAHPDQRILAAVLCELAGAAMDEDSEFLLCLYLPLLRGEHQALLAKLQVNDSFFVREALAEAIGMARLPGADAVIRALAADPHPQVREAAQRTAGLIACARGSTA